MTEIRKIAAILAADVVGYSKLAGADEDRTLARLRSLRSDLIDPTIAVHHGRVVKRTGDGALVEFRSVVEAVRCAIEVQNGMVERNAGLPSDRRIEFRIGIHLGDVVEESDGDLMGDGVNIAARLEGIAEPGGVCISDDAQRQIRGKVDIAFADMGAQILKNIAEPMRAWRLLIDQKPASSTAPTEPPTQKAQPLALPDKPSIAVLPFQNMSGDPEQEYFADGMAEDIITALSRFKSLFVIARNSSFTYKGRAVNIKQVGQELGVRYVLEGSVRKAGSRVRITGQLIEAASNRHLWADKFDGALEDVFDLQDQVTTSVVGLIAPTLERAEIERASQKPTDRLDSYDLYLRGMALVNERRALEARDFFKRAFELDPGYVAAYAMAAWTLLMQQSTSGVPLTAEMRTDAIRLAHLGSSPGTDDAFTLARSAHVLAYLGHEYDRGASMVEQAVALNPNLAVGWYSRGFIALMCGEDERAIESFERMIRLSPLDPLRIRAWSGSSFAFFGLGRYEDGFVSAMKAIQFASDAQSLGAYIVNAVRAGHAVEAREAVAQLLRSQPDFRASHAQDAFPMRSQEGRDRIAAALQDAGLPD